MMERLLTRLPPLSRSQWQLATGLVALVLLALLVSILRPAVASLAEVRAQRAQAEQAVHGEQLLRQMQRALESELGSAPKAPAAGVGEERTLFTLLGGINEVAERHQVTLDRLAPAPVRNVAMFRELPVEVELTGSYAEVSAMLLEIAQGGAQVSVSMFQIDRTEAAAEVRMRARLSMYQEEERKK